MTDSNQETGSLDEMITLASERAILDDGAVIVHRKGCDGPNDCLCQPKVLRPYESINGKELEAQ